MGRTMDIAKHGQHGARDVATCGICGRSWCEACDPAPSALCHYCHGRGYSTAPDAKRNAGKVPVPGEPLTCGHPCPELPNTGGTGYAWTADRKATLCYDCADHAQLAHMANADRITGYTSGSRPEWFTTWTEGRLARVTSYTRGRRRSTPTGGEWVPAYVYAVAADGSHWRGTGNADYDVITLRRVKSK